MLVDNGVVQVVLHGLRDAAQMLYAAIRHEWGPAALELTLMAVVNVLDYPRVMSDTVLSAIFSEDFLVGAVDSVGPTGGEGGGEGDEPTSDEDVVGAEVEDGDEEGDEDEDEETDEEMDEENDERHGMVRSRW
jgi:hypothetical protein